MHMRTYTFNIRERSDAVVECITRDLGAAGSSLTGVTACALELDILILA